MKNRMRILIIAIILCVLIPAASVRASTSTQTAEQTPFGYIEALPSSVTSSVLTGDHAYLVYRSLIEEHSDAIGVLYNGIASLQKEIDISRYHVPVEYRTILLHLLRSSFPELNYLNGFSCSYTDNTILTVEPRYSIEDPAEKKRLFMETAAAKYLPLIDDSMDDFTKAVILHDELILNTHYAVNSEQMHLSNNFTCMLDGWGVCQDYAECYAYLLAQCGIKSEIVQSDRMSHAWVKVQLDGHYYNVDITWDDPTPDKNGKARHHNFLFSDSVFQTADTQTDRKRHYDYKSIHPADSDKYDHFDNLHSFSTQLCYLNGSFYAITQDGKLVKYDHLTDSIIVLKTLNFKWFVEEGSSRYWVGNFSSLVGFSKLLYYNSPNEIYQYDPESDQTEVFAENTGDENFYGLRVIDQQLWVVRSDDPNDGNIEPDYIKDLPIPYYDITIDDTITGGVVTADKTTAAEGETVTLTVTSDKNAELVAVTVNQTRIDPVDGVYSFKMPASDVTVSAQFRRITHWAFGDVDGDKEITILDATAIQRVLVNLPTSSYNAAAADCDGDEEVTILDATAIQRWLVDLPTSGHFTDA